MFLTYCTYHFLSGVHGPLQLHCENTQVLREAISEDDDEGLAYQRTLNHGPQPLASVPTTQLHITVTRRFAPQDVSPLVVSPLVVSPPFWPPSRFATPPPPLQL